MKKLLFVFTHLAAIGLGFALGIHALSILVAVWCGTFNQFITAARYR